MLIEGFYTTVQFIRVLYTMGLHLTLLLVVFDFLVVLYFVLVAGTHSGSLYASNIL